MFNNLTPEMQERLEKWKANILPVKSAEKVRGPVPTLKRPPGHFVSRRGDYGDDIKDFEDKEEKAWAKDLQDNPIFRSYR